MIHEEEERKMMSKTNRKCFTGTKLAQLKPGSENGFVRKS